MLSYQHIFHAGNHADILKHYVLLFVLNSLNKKEKPYTFFDTHSGSGLYDLLDNRSLKTNEAEKGILQILNNNVDSNFYFDFIKAFIDNKQYPGSPVIELKTLRKSDFLVLSELHPQEYTNLKNIINILKDENNCSVAVHNRNGWEMLKALTPPKTKRGAVLIDPSYEEIKDYEDAAETIVHVNKKWNNGIILLWYPLLNHRSQIIENMLNQIIEGCKKNNQNIEISNLQLLVDEKDAHKEVALKEFLEHSEDIKNPPRLYGSGMLVINSPWMLKDSTEAFINNIEKIIRR